MADWVPVYRKAFRDARMVELAKACGVRLHEVVGLCALLWLNIADHSPFDGRISDVSDATIETWAEWNGRTGRFATAYRRLFQVTEGEHDGEVRNWFNYIGYMLAKLERDRQRKRDARRGESAGPSADASADGPADSLRNGARGRSGRAGQSPPKSPADAVGAVAVPASAAAAGDGEPPTPEQREANARRLREAVIAAGVLPVASVPVADTPEALAELQARKDAAKRQLAERTAKRAEAAHG